MNDEMFQLWTDLDTSRRLAEETHIDPWDSQTPEVQQNWGRIIDPQHLATLLDWERTNSPLNPVAQRMVTQAIAQARSNQEGETTTIPE